MFRHRKLQAGVLYSDCMKIAGLITEYNPFHNGHLYHIRKTRELLNPDVLVVVVSSWFTQRGLPSLISRTDKTRIALENGADLVIELPSVYAAQAADRFALYAVEALKTAGADCICFGSETGDLQKLESMARAAERIRFSPDQSMIRSLNRQLEKEFQTEDLKSNDILGIQYIRWCREFGIEPYCIKRSPDFKSATATRHDYFQASDAGLVPDEYLSGYFHEEQRWESYYPVLRNLLVLSDADRLSSYFLVTEGIENRLKKAAERHADWSGFLEQCISKKYTRARIQRTCLFILLQVTKEQMEKNHSFFMVRVLGMNSKGAALLKTRPEGTPIASRFAQLPDFLKEVERKSRFLYNSVLNHPVSDQEVVIYE